MKLLKSYDLLNDKKLIKWLNIWSIVFIVFFFIIFTVITMIFKGNANEIKSPLIELLLMFGLLVVLIVIHELIHGLFFKVFKPEAKVKFGYKNGMAYATSPNSKYSRSKFAIISLAPFILITSVLFTCYMLNVLPKTMFIFIAALHAGACVGDFYWVWLVATSPKGCLIEDTDKGIDFYQ